MNQFHAKFGVNLSRLIYRQRSNLFSLLFLLSPAWFLLPPPPLLPDLFCPLPDSFCPSIPYCRCTGDCLTTNEFYLKILKQIFHPVPVTPLWWLQTLSYCLTSTSSIALRVSSESSGIWQMKLNLYYMFVHTNPTVLSIFLLYLKYLESTTHNSSLMRSWDVFFALSLN